MRANKSRVCTRIINSGLEEFNSMKLLLYGEQRWGYDGNQGWVLIQSADVGMDAQGTGWGVASPKYPSGDECPGARLVFGLGFNGWSELSKGQARQLGRVLEKWLMWVRGFVRVGHEVD